MLKRARLYTLFGADHSELTAALGKICPLSDLGPSKHSASTGSVPKAAVLAIRQQPPYLNQCAPAEPGAAHLLLVTLTSPFSASHFVPSGMVEQHEQLDHAGLNFTHESSNEREKSNEHLHPEVVTVLAVCVITFFKRSVCLPGWDDKKSIVHQPEFSGIN